VVSNADEQTAGTMGFWGALTQIIIADVSMSLDNVLAVAGAAKGPYVGAGGRPGRRRRADGRGRHLHRQAVGSVPLDHLDRPAR
jgi:hypothetical protein